MKVEEPVNGREMTVTLTSSSAGSIAFARGITARLGQGLLFFLTILLAGLFIGYQLWGQAGALKHALGELAQLHPPLRPEPDLVEQPIQFSHERHVAGNGIDCRYCHTSVEKAAFAGIPPTKTCMNCHSQIWAQSPYLEPVRASFRNDTSLEWNRVNDLPDFVYFDHSIHVAKGVGCETCHGRVDEMPLVWQAARLQMSWCLDCHRNPVKNVRPKQEVFNLNWNGDDPRSAAKYLWPDKADDPSFKPPQDAPTI